MGSIPLKPSWRLLPLFVPITKFVHNHLLGILLWLTYLQEGLAIGNKIKNLLSQLSTLETHFATCPSDVEEQRGRSELIQYVFTPLLHPALSPF